MRTGAQRRVLEIPCSAALINRTNSPKSDRRRQCTLRSLAHSSQVVRCDLRLRKFESGDSGRLSGRSGPVSNPSQQLPGTAPLVKSPT